MNKPLPHECGNPTPPEKSEQDLAADEHADKDEIVLTPGGYRHKSDVRQVGPDEVLRVNEDGSVSIVKKVEP